MDVEPARRDVAGDEEPDLVVLETLQRLGPLWLRHIAMQCGRIQPMPAQGALQDIDVAFAVAEDEGVLDVLAGDQVPQRVALVFRRDDNQRLLDQRGWGGGRRDRDADRVLQESVRQAADLRWHRRGEEQRLARPRQEADDALDIGDKAHIEHPVGFVDDQDADIREEDLAAFEQVEEAARRRDQHIDAAVEFALLVAKALAADQEGRREPVMLAVALKGGLDLGRELARRLEDQRARHPRPRPSGGELVDHRQRKAGGLAGAGLGTAQYVAPLGDDGDGLLLDRGGGGIAGVCYRLQKFRRESQFVKIH